MNVWVEYFDQAGEMQFRMFGERAEVLRCLDIHLDNLFRAFGVATQHDGFDFDGPDLQDWEVINCVDETPYGQVFMRP